MSTSVESQQKPGDGWLTHSGRAPLIRSGFPPAPCGNGGCSGQGWRTTLRLSSDLSRAAVRGVLRKLGLTSVTCSGGRGGGGFPLFPGDSRTHWDLLDLGRRSRNAPKQTLEAALQLRGQELVDAGSKNCPAGGPFQTCSACISEGPGGICLPVLFCCASLCHRPPPSSLLPGVTSHVNYLVSGFASKETQTERVECLNSPRDELQTQAPAAFLLGGVGGREENKCGTPKFKSYEKDVIEGALPS